jgi:hypothetical protein
MTTSNARVVFVSFLLRFDDFDLLIACRIDDVLDRLGHGARSDVAMT